MGSFSDKWQLSGEIYKGQCLTATWLWQSDVLVPADNMWALWSPAGTMVRLGHSPKPVWLDHRLPLQGGPSCLPPTWDPSPHPPARCGHHVPVPPARIPHRDRSCIDGRVSSSLLTFLPCLPFCPSPYLMWCWNITGLGTRCFPEFIPIFLEYPEWVTLLSYTCSEQAENINMHSHLK